MTRKGALSLDTLVPLGAAKLAQVILDETETNPAFRKRVTAALASTKGPDAVAKLIDRRLAALERARAMVGWETERAFAEDLGATVETITRKLAPLSPAHAVERLLHFVDMHGSVFERIDDSNDPHRPPSVFGGCDRRAQRHGPSGAPLAAFHHA